MNYQKSFYSFEKKKSGLLRAISLSKDQIEKISGNWFKLKPVNQGQASSTQALYDWDQVSAEAGVRLNMFKPLAGKLFSTEGLPEQILLLGNCSQNYKVLLIHPYNQKPAADKQLPYSDRYWDKD